MHYQFEDRKIDTPLLCMTQFLVWDVEIPTSSLLLYAPLRHFTLLLMILDKSLNETLHKFPLSF